MKHQKENLESWKDLIDAWTVSGQSQTAFCKQKNIKLDLFGYYKKKYQSPKKEVVAKKQPSSGFSQVAVPKSANPVTTLQMTFPCGIVLSGIQPNNLMTVSLLMEVMK